MPKAPNMYECSRCGNYMTFKERTKKQNILNGPGGHVKYWQDLCPPCVQADVEGQDVKPVTPRANKSARQDQSPAQPDGGIGDRPAAKANGSAARRTRAAKDSDSAAGRRGHTTPSGVR